MACRKSLDRRRRDKEKTERKSEEEGLRLKREKYVHRESWEQGKRSSGRSRGARPSGPGMISASSWIFTFHYDSILILVFIFYFFLLSSFVDWSGCHRSFVFARPLPDHAWPYSTSIPCVWPLAYTTNWPKPHLLFSIAPKLINPSTLHACDHLAWEWRTPLPFAAKPFLYPHLCPLLICSLPSTPSSLIPTIYPSPTTNLPYPSHRHQTHFLSLGFLHPVVNPSTKLLPRWPPKPPPTRPPAPPPSVADDASVQAAIVGTRHLQRRSTASSWE